MSWVWLIAAICLEVCGTLCMRASDGFAKLVPTVVMFVLYICSLSALSLAVKRIDVSIAYAVWSGLGTALITLLAAPIFGEPLSWTKALCVGLIIGGVVGLNLAGGAH